MLNKILLIGGGGHCKSVLDTLLKADQYNEIGIIDQRENIGESLLSIPFIGCDEDLPSFYQDGFIHAFVTVGSVYDSMLRIKLFNMIEQIGFIIPNIIDNTAILGSDVKLDKGIFIGKNTIINTGSIINKGAIINTGSIVEHDCKIDEFVHIAPGAVLCGEVKIGAKTHIGAKSVVKQNVNIGANTIIGMGSTVLTGISDNTIAFGNPCREVRSM